ncbi:MAG: phosphoadenylyl-sulfate reductase [Rhizobiaceae bacterium]|jgi:phosphoadenosine phosphosulfate reductase|nr:phosphoadenylyl-sulfate reductase [Rhizobiaceae bacterium]
MSASAAAVLDLAWPPGGHDPVLSALAERHIGRDGALDFASAIRDPLLGRLAMVSSFGADSAVLLHQISRINPEMDILFIDTGKHFAETLDYVDTLSTEFGLANVRFIRPDAGLIALEDSRAELWQKNPDLCCMLRKTFPLQDALSGYQSWITGRKRFQGASRAALPFFERDGDHIKLNPLAKTSAEDILSYARRHDLPQHPLVERGFLSIGCAPCTRAVKPGEDPRAGRWSGLNKVECGIHLGPDANFARQSLAARGDGI